jgi:hypothetical protein
VPFLQDVYVQDDFPMESEYSAVEQEQDSVLEPDSDWPLEHPVEHRVAGAADEDLD